MLGKKDKYCIPWSQLLHRQSPRSHNDSLLSSMTVDFTSLSLPPYITRRSSHALYCTALLHAISYRKPSCGRRRLTLINLNRPRQVWLQEIVIMIVLHHHASDGLLCLIALRWYVDFALLCVFKSPYVFSNCLVYCSVFLMWCIFISIWNQTGIKYISHVRCYCIHSQCKFSSFTSLFVSEICIEHWHFLLVCANVCFLTFVWRFFVLFCLRSTLIYHRQRCKRVIFCVERSAMDGSFAGCFIG